MRGSIWGIRMALASWARRWWWVLGGLLGVVVVVGIGVNLTISLARETDELLRQIGLGISDKDRADLTRSAFQYRADNLAKIWTTIVQAAVGLVLATGAVATWRNLRVANEAQITNRFTQAIGQLGAMKDKEPNLEVRLGGIYALERIARDSPRDHWTIMEVLTAYVRQNAGRTPPSSSDAVASSSPEWPREEMPKSRELAELRTDIQAILTVLGRRHPPREWPEPGVIDLRGADLRGADLSGAHLSWAHLSGADLSEAYLSGANLIGANLIKANLIKANLNGANLSNAYLIGANLSGGKLSWAILRMAELTGADLSGADLSGTKRLTVYQVKSARSYARAQLPPEIAEELDRLATESAPSPPTDLD